MLTEQYDTRILYYSTYAVTLSVIFDYLHLTMKLGEEGEGGGGSEETFLALPPLLFFYFALAFLTEHLKLAAIITGLNLTEATFSKDQAPF